MQNPFLAPGFRMLAASADESPAREHEFFSSLRMPNGTFKTTIPGRLNDVDEWLIDRLKPGLQPADFLDVGVSSGTLTAELADALERRSFPFRMFGSDLYLNAEITRRFPFTVLTCAEETLLQVDVLGLSFPNTPPSRLGNLVFRLARAAREKARRRGPKFQQTIQLLSAKARASKIQFATGDIWGTVYEAEPNQQYDLIRVANLLNRSYFSEERLRAALTNLRRFLKPEGLLLIVHSTEQANHATLARPEQQGWQIADRFHEGVSIEDLLVRSGLPYEVPSRDRELLLNS